MSISSPRTGKGKTSRSSEGVIKLHSQEQLLNLLLDTGPGSKIDSGVGREVLSPSPRRSEPIVFPRKVENQSPVIRSSTRSSTVNHNLHQKTLEDRGEREVLSATPPKVVSNAPTAVSRDSWLASRARHRRSQTRESPKESSLFSVHPQPLVSINFNPTPTPPRPITRQRTPNVEIPAIPIPQKETAHLPPISWKRTSAHDNIPDTPTVDSLVSSISLTKLPSVQFSSIPNERHDGEVQLSFGECSRSSSPSSSQPTLLSPSSSSSSLDILSPSIHHVSSPSPSPSPSSSPPPSPPSPPSPKPSFTANPSPNISHSSTDETTFLSLTVLRQHHKETEEVLAHRLTLLKTAHHLLSRNGGLPSGIPFSLEYLITCGDVAALADVAKAFFCITEDGSDGGEEREEINGADYTGMAAWLTAVPMMMKEGSAHHHVVVGLRVASIVISGLEQWVDTAIGIAQSLGPDAIPDELRDQCYKYNEFCRNILPCIERVERKGRIGVLANEVYQLLVIGRHFSQTTVNMFSKSSTVTLNNVGTFQAHSEDVKKSVSYALDAGYSRIDTAAIYRNEKYIGQELAERGLNMKEKREGERERDTVFITSKVPPAALTTEGTTLSCLTSLSDLQVDYVDLMLIHWPAKSGLKKESPKHVESRKEAWQALEALYDQGKCKAIGVSNYTVDHLKQMQTIKPAVNQVECHPFLQQSQLREWCKANDIFVEAYSSLGTGQLLTNEVVQDIAKAYNKEPAQILLRWGLQQNLAVIPKSVNKDRVYSNFQLFDFNISETDMQRLNALECNNHFCWDPTDVK